MRTIQLLIAISACILLYSCQTNSAANTQKENTANVNKPNVLLILVDDLGWTDLGVTGSKYYQTPHVNQLANQGVLFTNAYSACTVCSPSRASILTGKYPATLNCTDWIKGWQYPNAALSVPDWTMYLDSSEHTLAEAFKTNGYRTAHIGKWHLGDDSIHWPQHQGFDVNIAGWSKGAPNRNKKIGSNGYFPPFGNPMLTDSPTDTYLTERLATEACNYIANNNPRDTGQPFFLNYWFYTVHTPLQAQPEKVKKYKQLRDTTQQQQNPTYAAMVEHMDDAVGRIRQQLKKEGLDKNTLIIFTSDNGGLLGRAKIQVTDNSPLRQGKGHMYEGATRVPLIIYDPRTPNASMRISHSPAISADLYPTLVDLLGLRIPTTVKTNFDGISLRSNINGHPSTREALYWHYPHYHIEGAKPYSAVRSGDWKLIRFLEQDRYELYNLAEDLSETNDLAAQEKETTERLKQLLFTWYKKVDAQMPTKNPNFEAQKSNIHASMH